MRPQDTPDGPETECEQRMASDHKSRCRILADQVASLKSQLAECERSRQVYATDAATYSAKLGVLEDDNDELWSLLLCVMSAASALLGYVEGKYDIQDGQFKCPYFQRLHGAVARVQGRLDRLHQDKPKENPLRLRGSWTATTPRSN